MPPSAMKVLVVLNGEPPDPEKLKKLSEKFPLYAADGGAAVCLRAGVRPVCVAGDFDSQDSRALPEDWTVEYFPEQDRTDFHKILSCLPEKVEEILILGGLGRRLDHQLTNLMIALTLPEPVRVVFEDGEHLLHRVTPQCPFQGTLPPGRTVSLLPLSPAEQVVTRGLRWELAGVDMKASGQLGQSNLTVDEAVEVRVQKGSLFVWVSGTELPPPFHRNGCQ